MDTNNKKNEKTIHERLLEIHIAVAEETLKINSEAVTDKELFVSVKRIFLLASAAHVSGPANQKPVSGWISYWFTCFLLSHGNALLSSKRSEWKTGDSGWYVAGG